MTGNAPPTVQVLTRANGGGLTRDLALLTDILIKAGCPTTATKLGHRSRFGWHMQRLHHWLHGRTTDRAGPRHDINLMLERVYPGHFHEARCNVLIPNPEWTRRVWLPWLSHFDLIATKTRHAMPLFEPFGQPVRWIGFAGSDHLDRSVKREQAFLHMPGRSDNKGTRRLLELWARHPEWPMLTAVWRHPEAPGTAPENITLVRDYLDEARLHHLQNRHRFHLCPSQTEGFGHYIVEAMGVGAVIVTTDAAPMNEMIDTRHGIPVASHAGNQQALATLHDFDETAMEAAITRCLAMTPAECDALGTRARQWFEQNNADFPGRLMHTLDETLAKVEHRSHCIRG